MMVAPEREVPGISANACAKPILSASLPAHLIDALDAPTQRIAALPPLRPQDDEGTDDECRRNRHRREQVSLDRLVERESDDGRRA